MRQFTTRFLIVSGVAWWLSASLMFTHGLRLEVVTVALAIIAAIFAGIVGIWTWISHSRAAAKEAAAYAAENAALRAQAAARTNPK